MKRSFGVLLSILLVVIAVAGCGKPTDSGLKSKDGAQSVDNKPESRPEPAPAKVEGSVVVYSSASKDLLDAMTPALKVKYPNLDVQWVYGGTEELVDKLSAEFSAGSVKADSIMMADPAYARLLKSQGLLQPYVPAGAASVKVDRDADGFYTAVRVLDVVIIYNPDKVKAADAPKSFKDLLDPKWKNSVVMSDPTKSGTAFATVGALVGKYGWDYFVQAQANGWKVGGGSSSPVTKVGDGSAKIGLAVESSFRSAKAKGAKVEMVWPEDGAIVLESPYAILKSSKNVTGAKAVADWLITAEAQGLMTNAGMHPVISGVNPPSGSIPLDDLLGRAMKVSWEQLSKEKGQIQDKFLQTVTVQAK